MEEKILNFISDLKLGKMEQFRNIAVFPLFSYKVDKIKLKPENKAKDMSSFKKVAVNKARVDVEDRAENGAGNEYISVDRSESKAKASDQLSLPPYYITLDEAISSGVLKIKEVSTAGNVPELIAENKSNHLILLLDGEEVVGAKQNRVLNTTILLDKFSKTIIPVSCVEEGRWSYSSETFTATDNLLNYDIRKAKNQTVSKSLKSSEMYMSDQEQIWADIDELYYDMVIDSRTKALSDVYKSFDDELSQYIKNFICHPDQTGIFVFIDGKIAGFDNISLPDAYKSVHSKLLKSYCMDALRKDFERKNRDIYSNNNEYNKNIKDNKQHSSNYYKDSPQPSLERAKYFLEEIKLCNENHFKSVGLGMDYRYDSRHAIGSALLYDETVIHIAFFKNDEHNAEGVEGNKTSNMQSYKNRRNNRLIIY